MHGNQSHIAEVTADDVSAIFSRNARKSLVEAVETHSERDSQRLIEKQVWHVGERAAGRGVGFGAVDIRNEFEKLVVVEAAGRNCWTHIALPTEHRTTG